MAAIVAFKRFVSAGSNGFDHGVHIPFTHTTWGSGAACMNDRLKFSVIYIRVQCPEVKCIEPVS
jgi:hypothetical protein